VFGYVPTQPTDAAAVVAAAAERWHVLHVLVSNSGQPSDAIVRHWEGVLGGGVLTLRKLDAICELLGVVMALREGRLTVDAARAILTTAGLPPVDVQRALAT
jgi:hypothetical protein